MSCEFESSQGQLYTVATQNNLKRYFVSIEYPGRVINDENAFRTMGGLTEMSVVHATENRKYLIAINHIFHHNFNYVMDSGSN